MKKAVWLYAGTAVLLLLFLFGQAIPAKRFSVFGGGAARPTLVLDAGHGGFDGGAVGAGGTSEQAINLSITRSLDSLYHFFGWPTVLTRKDEQALDYVAGRAIRENKVSDIKAREKIVQQTSDPVFISIHLNKFEDPKYYGAQVFYSKNNEQGKPLAEDIQAALIGGIPNGNIRRAKPAASSIYLMKKLDCPAVIVECGFLSNPAEESKLSDPAYHKQLAVCIFGGSMQYLGGETSA